MQKGDDKDMTPYNDIFKLNAKGYNHSQIANILGNTTRKTVITVLQLAEQYNLTYPFSSPLTDLEIHRILHPKKTKAKPNLNETLYELNVTGKTIIELWEEYCEKCHKENVQPYSKSMFQNFIVEAKEQITIPEYKSTIVVKYIKTGYEDDLKNTHGLLFAEDMDSHYVVVVDVADNATRTWIKALIKLIHSYDYIPNVICFYNKLPKAVVAQTKDCLEHYGIETIETKPDFTIEPLIKELVISLNSRENITPFNVIQNICESHNNGKLEGIQLTRKEALDIEKKVSKGFPEYEYELIEFTQVKPQLNYHVEIQSMYYSVPFEFRHELITAYIYDDYVELHVEGNAIAVHDKLKGIKGQYSTDPDHVPNDIDIPYGETSGKSLRSWASKIGPYTFKVIDAMLKRPTFEVQAYKTCNTILHYSTEYSYSALEAACEQAINSKIISYRFIKNCMTM